MIAITIVDEDITAHDTVGECKLKVSELQENDDCWFTLKYRGRSAGKIQIKSIWTSDLHNQDTYTSSLVGGSGIVTRTTTKTMAYSGSGAMNLGGDGNY